MNKYFLSFVEEFWPKQKVKIVCRMEVSPEPAKDAYDKEEVHFHTDRVDEYEKLREKWDFKTVTEEELGYIKKYIEDNFNEEIRDEKND